MASCVTQKSSSVLGILKGQIGIYEGNCMPSPGVEPCEARPYSTTILITNRILKYDSSELLYSTQSNEQGLFEIRLPKGQYSLFIVDQAEKVCVEIQCPEDCYCRPFEIVTDSTTTIDANLNQASW